MSGTIVSAPVLFALRPSDAPTGTTQDRIDFHMFYLDDGLIAGLATPLSCVFFKLSWRSSLTFACVEAFDGG